MRFSTFKLIMALVALYDLECYQVDMITAFVNDDLDEEVFMEVPSVLSMGLDPILSNFSHSLWPQTVF